MNVDCDQNRLVGGGGCWRTASVLSPSSRAGRPSRLSWPGWRGPQDRCATGRRAEASRRRRAARRRRP